MDRRILDDSMSKSLYSIDKLLKHIGEVVSIEEDDADIDVLIESLEDIQHCEKVLQAVLKYYQSKGKK